MDSGRHFSPSGFSKVLEALLIIEACYLSYPYQIGQTISIFDATLLGVDVYYANQKN
jgi:hypothetical protein